MPAWFDSVLKIVEVIVVILLAVQASGRWLQRREDKEEAGAESIAGFRRELVELESKIDRRVHVNEWQTLERTIERIDKEMERQRDNYHDLRRDVQQVLMQFANMGGPR